MKLAFLVLTGIAVVFIIIPTIGMVVGTYVETKEIIRIIDDGCHISTLEEQFGKAQPHNEFQPNELPDRLSQFDEMNNKGIIYTRYWVEGIQTTEVVVGRDESGNIVWGYINGAFIEDVVIINEEYLVDQ